VPRVMPKQPRFRADEIVKSWQSFSYDDQQGGHTIRTGVRLRGDHPAVLRCPWCFVREDQPDDRTPSLYQDLVEPQPRFRKPTRVRVKCRVLHGVAVYEKGHEFTAPAATASWLLDEGLADEA